MTYEKNKILLFLQVKIWAKEVQQIQQQQQLRDLSVVCGTWLDLNLDSM